MGIRKKKGRNFEPRQQAQFRGTQVWLRYPGTTSNMLQGHILTGCHGIDGPNRNR